MIPGFENTMNQLHALTVCGDLISRTAAIEEIKKNIWDDAIAHDVIDLLKEMPSIEMRTELLYEIY